MACQVGIGELAVRLKHAVEYRDLDQIARLLAPDVRWGADPGAPETCHDRSEVLRWYEELDSHGVRAIVEELGAGGDVIMLRLRVTWPDPASEAQEFVRYQVFHVEDGLIATIRGYPDEASALASVLAGQTAQA